VSNLLPLHPDWLHWSNHGVAKAPNALLKTFLLLL